MKIHLNGIDMHYEIAGEGPWVVMSHSLACSLRMWDDEVQALADRFRILRYDTRGHGLSSAPEGAYSLDLLAQDLIALLDHFDIRQPRFVGLSMGGMIGMTAELARPGLLGRMSLCDTTSRIPEAAAPVWAARIATAQAQGMEPLVQPTLERWFTPPTLARGGERLERVAQMIRSTPVAGYIGCCHAIPRINLTDRLGAIGCLVQVLVGDADVGTPVAMSEEIHRAIPGSSLVIIPQASHLSNLEQPEAFQAALADFLS
jgi:3-oxoadipate enol-lactonase